MINRLEFIIMFFGFGTWVLIKPDPILFLMMTGSCLCWIYYFLEDWNYQDDYEDDH